MRIGFDAKRAFHNGTGLGHYSRSLLHALSQFYPDNEYYLFNPKENAPFELKGESLHEVNPVSVWSRLFPSAWRSSWVKQDLRRLEIELYHGLSHEIPLNIQKTRTRSVVTMHDLIHERYPEQYSCIDVKIYSKKFRYAAAHADRIIAISEQTKNDLTEFYGVDPQKISLCYQSCNPAFGIQVSENEKKAIRDKYHLPPQFFLYVGSVIERKNLLNVCKALQLLPASIDLPLVVIGRGGVYMQTVKKFLSKVNLLSRVIFLSEQTNEPSFRDASDFPAIYQSATAMLYPSFFEGFGIPVLEALWSRLPVITSNRSSLTEAGGNAAFFVDPSNPGEIANAMEKIVSSPAMVREMKDKGWAHAQNFSPEICARCVMSVYQQILRK